MPRHSHNLRIAAVIPFYCGDATFPEALASVLAQTHPVDEIVVVDDASVATKATALQHLDRRVKLVRHPRNLGQSAARQTGAESTTAELIAYLDQDDIWLPQKLERQLDVLHAHPDFDAVHTALIEFRANGCERVFDAKPAVIDLAESLRINHVMPSSLMIRREALDAVGGWTRMRNVSEDHDLNIRMIAAGQRIGFIAEALVRFRRCEQGNLSSRRWWQVRANLRLMVKHRALYVRTLGLPGTFAVGGRYIAEIGRDPGWAGRGARLVGRILGHHESRGLSR